MFVTPRLKKLQRNLRDESEDDGICCDVGFGADVRDELDEIILGTRNSPRSVVPDLGKSTIQHPPSLDQASINSFDDNTFSDDEGQNLLWRIDPRTSHSDWTIRVIGQDRKTSQFHVHKTTLSIGNRKSQYFARTFQARSSCNVTEIRNITELEVRAMPRLLDYIYSGTLKISTSNATALYALSKRFEIKSLHTQTKTFWTGDIENCKNASVYFQHSKILNEANIQKALIKVCTKNLSVLVEINDMDLFLQVIDLLEPDTNLETSNIIANFCQQNVKQLDTALFFRITAPLRQSIDPKAAVALLHVQQALPVRTAEDAAKKKDFALRCINILAAQWTTDEPLYSLLPDGFLQERYLKKSIEHARKDYENEQKNHNQQIVAMKKGLDEAVKQAEDAEREKKEHERVIFVLKQRIKELERQLNRQRGVLGRIVAVLADRFPLLTCYGHHDDTL